MRDDVNTLMVVYAVIVSYNPDLDKLAELLGALLPQVQGVVVVDNGSSEAVLAWLNSQRLSVPLLVVPLGENLGIARAHNVGIDAARAVRASYVILFDQDSVPECDMVAKLLAAAEYKSKQGIKVSGVGPNYLDARQDNPPPFIKVTGLRVQRQMCTSIDAVLDVDYLISSGCLISIPTLDEVGGMREDFFIDYVDIEWGLRAKVQGFQSFGVCGARMAHDLGDEPIQFLGKQYPHHSPLRHYYHFRNAVWMYRQRWVPFQWRLVDGWRLLLKFGFYTLFAKPRYEHLKMMTQGVIHGFIGRMGRMN